jgi:hypothetical protein
MLFQRTTVYLLVSFMTIEFIIFKISDVSKCRRRRQITSIRKYNHSRFCLVALTNFVFFEVIFIYRHFNYHMTSVHRLIRELELIFLQPLALR